MRRTIPSLIQLFEIEKLNCLPFKRLLPTKKDKQDFDKVFDNAKLYASYLGNASDSIVVEFVMINGVFHNYKQIGK